MGSTPPKESGAKRKVKTLLLTKINHDAYSFDSYRGMYDNMRNKRYGKAFSQGVRYLSLGSVDAFSLYDTTTEEVLNGNNWFGELYNDRREIILDSSEKICYHPIHLIANKSENTANTVKQSGPFCLVTLIYGITEDEAQLNQKINRATCEHLSDNEWKIKAFLQGINPLPSGSIEVYNAVNLCDAVIIWYTDDIIGTLKCADLIAGSNFARKTFTLVGIQWSTERHFISQEASAALRTHSEGDAYSLKIQGSIRDRRSFDSLESAIVAEKEFNDQKACQITDYVSYLVPGQADFTILINALSGIQLEGILRFYLFGNTKASQARPESEESVIDLVSPACWDIHTDLLFNNSQPGKRQSTGQEAEEAGMSTEEVTENGAPNEGMSQNGIQPLEETKMLQFDATFSINNPAETIISLYKKYCNNILKKLDYAPWAVAFFELLTVHASIDRHPVLSGTSFLVHRFLEVTYYYLNQWKNADKEDDRKKAEKMLEQSQDTLQEVIRVWGVLTEQMLRIDDFVFRGIGNSSVLFNTLPECALDFYHAFLHQFVDVLLKMDEECNRKKKDVDYHYDFLLLPELDRKISILPVFNADASWKPDDKTVRQLGPPQQVFIVYFPIETVFTPIGFFAPLLHECFHYFGDTFRLRKKRTLFFCRFLANLIVANISGSWYKVPIHPSFKLASITEIIYNHLHSLFENNPEENYYVEAEPTEAETSKYLSLKNVKDKLRKDEVARELCDRLSAQITCEFGFDILSLEGLRLRKSIFDILYNEYENTKKTPTQYLDIGIWLEAGIQKIFVDDDEDGLKLIQYSAKVEYEKLELAYKETKNNRGIKKKDNTPDVFTNWGDTLGRGWYYFKECYADLMMIQILDLAPDKYLSLFWNEMQDEKDWISTAQRIAFVLAVAYEENEKTLKASVAEALTNAENDADQLSKDKKDKQKKACGVIRSIIKCLLEQDSVSDLGKEAGILPTATWVDIYDYLIEVRNQFNSVLNTIPEIAEKVKEMQSQFSAVFESGGFLSNSFFKVIHKHHEKTLSLLNRSTILLKKLDSLISISPNASVTAALQQLSLQLSTSDADINSDGNAGAILIDSLLVEVESNIKSGNNEKAIYFCKLVFDAIIKASRAK